MTDVVYLRVNTINKEKVISAIICQIWLYWAGGRRRVPSREVHITGLDHSDGTPLYTGWSLRAMRDLTLTWYSWDGTREVCRMFIDVVPSEMFWREHWERKRDTEGFRRTQALN